MENQENELPQDYKEGFNNGYLFAKENPEISNKVLEQNIPSSTTAESIEKDLSKLNGLFAGINEFFEEQKKEQTQSRLDEINNLRDKLEGDSQEKDIER